MTDNQQDTTPDEAVTVPVQPVVEDKPVSAPAAPARSKSGRGVAWLALLLSLLIGGGGAYLWRQQDVRVDQQLNQIVQARETDIKTLQQQFAEQRSAADALKSETGALKSQNQTQDKEEQNLRGGLDNLQQQIKNLQDSHQMVQASVDTQQGNYQTHRSAIQALQQDVQALTGNLQGLKDQLEKQVDERKKMLAEVDNRVQNLQLAQRNLLTTLDNVKAVMARGGDVNAFPLSEVEYLLRLADYKLRFQQDVPDAIAALNEAYQRLGAVNEEIFSGVRQMIRENIASLKGVDLPDRSTLAQKIIEMESRLGALPLRNEGQIAALKEHVKPHDVQTAPGETTQPWWERLGSLAREQFKDIVVVRRSRSNEPPLMAVQEEYFLLQNLRMELEAMRIALLSNDVPSYLESDATAQKWVKTYFDTSDSSVGEFLAELETLRNIKLKPYIPTVATTLQAFLDAMQTRKPVRSVTMPAAGDAAGEARP